MYDLVFLASAIGAKYEEFLVPFTFFALLNNPNSFVEIIVSDTKKFKTKYQKELDEIIKIVGKFFLIRTFTRKLNKNIPNTYRFFELPITKAHYTYILDVDIMLLENILPIYLKNWPGNAPYNNIIRENTNRLTGVHLVKTNQYYTPLYKSQMIKFYKENKSANDELILFKMCAACHKMVDRSFKWRPILGIHFSPNRGKNKTIQNTTCKIYFDKFLVVKNKYPNIFSYKCFSNLVKNLETFILT